VVKAQKTRAKPQRRQDLKEGCLRPYVEMDYDSFEHGHGAGDTHAHDGDLNGDEPARRPGRPLLPGDNKFAWQLGLDDQGLTRASLSDPTRKDSQTRLRRRIRCRPVMGMEAVARWSTGCSLRRQPGDPFHCSTRQTLVRQSCRD